MLDPYHRYHLIPLTAYLTSSPIIADFLIKSNLCLTSFLHLASTVHVKLFCHQGLVFLDLFQICPTDAKLFLFDLKLNLCLGTGQLLAWTVTEPKRNLSWFDWDREFCWLQTTAVIRLQLLESNRKCEIDFHSDFFLSMFFAVIKPRCTLLPPVCNNLT